LTSLAQRPPPAGCTYESVTARAEAIYAIQACGHSTLIRLDGPVSLVQFDSRLLPVRTWALRQCTDGNDLAVNALGQVMVSVYQICPPGGPGPQIGPQTYLDLLTHNELRTLTTVQGGTLAFDQITW
jgi:hypothetical protein